MTNEQETFDKANKNWEIMKVMACKHNSIKVKDDYTDLLNYINDNLDPTDENLVSMALDCIIITFEESKCNESLYASIWGKIKDLQVRSLKSACRLSAFEFLMKKPKNQQ